MAPWLGYISTLFNRIKILLHFDQLMVCDIVICYHVQAMPPPGEEWHPSFISTFMSNLLSAIERVRRNQTDEYDWLYIAGSAHDLTLQTEADFGHPEYDETLDKEIEPAGFSKRDLQITIDVATVEDCIKWADRLAGTEDPDAALDVIRYYIRFDAFPETLNPPDPPSAVEGLRQLDREFCDKLGPEDLSKQCRQEGCHRGIVMFSAYCCRHHFENVQNRPYPFDD